MSDTDVHMLNPAGPSEPQHALPSVRNTQALAHARKYLLIEFILSVIVIILVAIRISSRPKDYLMCLFANLALILLRSFLRAYECCCYSRDPSITQMNAGYYFLFFAVTSVWAGVLIYSNFTFYGKLSVVSDNPTIFAGLLLILGYGYFVLIEAILFVFILLLFAAILLCCPKQRTAPIRHNLLEKLQVVKYDPAAFQEDSACGICFVEYNAQSEIIILPCHAKHNFHSECIRQWLKNSNVCPACRTAVTLKSLQKFSVMDMIEFLKHSRDEDV